MFNGFGIINKVLKITKNQVDTISGKINFTFSSPQLSGVAASQTALSFVRLNYVMNPNLQNNSVFEFSFTSPSSRIRFFRFYHYPILKNEPVLFDLTNHRLVKCSKNQDTVKILIPTTNSSQQLFLSDTADYQNTDLNEVQFNQFSAASLNISFLIVTHSTLIKSANKYADYRNKKGYSTLIAETQKLYDQFYFGYHHPLAIRHFIDYIWQSSTVKPSYLLLLEKVLKTTS